MPGFTAADRARVGDLRQLASVRRIVLDDGAERGVHALAFSTGGGLDFWALADRALDIGPLWWKGTPIAWISPLGFRSPFLHDAESQGGQGFGSMLSGMVITGGLDHIRQPVGDQPLHGRFPFTPADVRSYGEDWDAATPMLFCEGEATQWKRGGTSLRLHRRIEAPISGNMLTIIDTVENIGAKATPQALLYHCNLGFPAISAGTTVRSQDRLLLGPIGPPAPSAGNSVTSYPVEGAEGHCLVSTAQPDGSILEVTFRFDADTLPHLQLMSDLRPNGMLVAVEPCTSARLEGGLSDVERTLAPGEKRHYRLSIGFATRPVAGA